MSKFVQVLRIITTGNDLRVDDVTSKQPKHIQMNCPRIYCYTFNCYLARGHQNTRTLQSYTGAPTTQAFTMKMRVKYGKSLNIDLD